MEDGDGRGGIDGGGWERLSWVRFWAGNTEESGERFGGFDSLLIGLNPGADIECAAIDDAALEDGLVGDQDFGAAVSEDAAYFSEGELRVERNRDAAGANDGEKPTKAAAVVRSVNGDGLAGTKR